MSTTPNEQLFWAALENAGMFFQGNSPQQLAMHKLAAILDEAAIPYAIVGAMALNAHGYHRVTVDVDILVTRDGLTALKQRVLGRGYVEKFAGSKTLRDTEHNVAIDFLIAGDYPGDGKAKTVRFPDPAQTPIHRTSASFLSLPKLLDLKLASGMSAPHRLKDLADVMELIRFARLPLELADQLDPSVQQKYRELWRDGQVALDEIE